MILWIFLCLSLAIPPTHSLSPDILKLTPEESAHINEKCTHKASSETPAQRERTRINAAPNGLYSFMAYVGIDGQYACGAVFISQRHLVTIRDCLRTANGKKVSLHVGGVCYGENVPACSQNVEEVEIDAAIYDNQNWGLDTRDLAILQINALPESLASKVDFACLPEIGERLSSSGVVLGWGRMDYRTSTSYLRQADIGLRTNDANANFFGIISYPMENMSRSDQDSQTREFSSLGVDSCAGSAVVSLTESGKYVVHGLLLSTSWISRFGRTASNGLKVEKFLGDICSRVGLCVSGINPASAMPRLKMLSGFSSAGGTGYGFAGGYAEERETMDGRYCHLETTSGVDFDYENKTELKKLVWYNEAEAKVTIDAYTGGSELLNFDLGNAWKIKSDEEWYQAPDNPQLTLKVCWGPNRMPDGMPANCSSGLIFCWRNGFIDSEKQAPKIDNEHIRWACNPEPSSSVQFWNGMEILYDAENGFKLDFLHNISESREIGPLEFKDGCWYFRFIKWHESMKNYTYGIYAKENPSFLPFLLLEPKPLPGAFGNLDRVQMRVASSNSCNLIATLESQFAAPCHYKWTPMKQGGCGNEGGSDILTCNYFNSQGMARTTATRDWQKGSVSKEEVKSSETIQDQLSKTVDKIVENTAKETSSQMTEKLEASVSASIEASYPGVSLSLKTEVSKTMTNTMKSKISNSVSKSLSKSAAKQISNKLESVNTLKKVNTTSTDKLEEVTKQAELGTEQKGSTGPGIYQETCQQISVCYGSNVLVGGTQFKFWKEKEAGRFHPKRDGRFT